MPDKFRFLPAHLRWYDGVLADRRTGPLSRLIRYSSGLSHFTVCLPVDMMTDRSHFPVCLPVEKMARASFPVCLPVDKMVNRSYFPVGLPVYNMADGLIFLSAYQKDRQVSVLGLLSSWPDGWQVAFTVSLPVDKMADWSHFCVYRLQYWETCVSVGHVQFETPGNKFYLSFRKEIFDNISQHF